MSRVIGRPYPCLVLLLSLGACDVDLGARAPQTASSFGAVVYREACQRVSYTEDLAARARDKSYPLDVSGASYRAFCAGTGAAPPWATAPALQALSNEHDDIVAGIDQAFPDQLLDSLDGYLRVLTPLEDDGTVDALLKRSGGLLSSMGNDPALVAGLTHLSLIGGLRDPKTAGGVMRSVASLPGLDDFIGGSVPLLVDGGAARQEFLALLKAGAFELRHLTQDADQASTDRTPAVLADLLLSGSPALGSGKPLYLAARDFRGLPELALPLDPGSPYVLDPKLQFGTQQLGRANAAGLFLDKNGQPIPYVSPLPVLGQKGDNAPRDAAGRALRGDGQPLYRYVDLDQGLLLALLKDGHRLFEYRAQQKAGPGSAEMDIPLGLLRGAALLVGTRDPNAVKEKDGERLTFNGFDTRTSALLDMAHGALQVLRLPAADLDGLLQSVQTLMAKDANEGPLSRATKALLDASDEAKKPAYDGARIPADSTLFDDLAPIIARVLAVPGLVDDIIDATDAAKHPEVNGLGPITAQLLSERGYFFMRQPGAADGLTNLPQACVPDSNEASNGLTPCGVVGDFGHRPDRAAPDSDPTLDWSGKVTSDPRNNRSIMQRLLHMLADTNGKAPFCSGRYASFFGGVIKFPGACDMFEIDNVARFFLLSIASRPLRSDPDTFAKQSASFLEAIRNGADCRGTSGDTDPTCDAKCKCNALLSTIDDGTNGDNVLTGLLGIQGFDKDGVHYPGFGRYPEPNQGARALFLDLSGTAASIKRSQDLLYNHIRNADGSLSVDTADPDGRKFIDGNGKPRLLINEHNGVLFALEKVSTQVKLPDGSMKTVTFYDAMRPLVDAFARHAECFSPRDTTGKCSDGQNATQILADAMGVLHRHWPTARSGVFGRSFADSYGPAVKPDAAMSYEPLAVKIMQGDLLPATGDLSPILFNLTVDGQVGSQRALPLIVKLARLVFDPSQAPVGLTFRGGPATARRNDGAPAYADPTLERVLGKKYDGQATPYYLIAAGLKEKRDLFDKPENQAAKDRWNRAVSDAIDVFMQVQVVSDMSGQHYQFVNRRIRPVTGLALDTLRRRVTAHAKDTTGWSRQMEADLTDALSGPLLSGLMDLGTRLDADDNARRKTYTLLSQLLDETPENIDTLRAMAASSADAVQVLLDDADLVPIGRGLAAALDPATGPVDPALQLAKRGRELELMSDKIPERPVLIKVLRNLYAPDQAGIYALFRLSDAIGEINRATPGKGGDLNADDYRALLLNTASFLTDQQRGMSRFIQIVQSRCVAGGGKCGQASP